MNIPQANKLLDRVKDGQPVPTHLIEYALFLTGDLDDEQFDSVGSGQRHLYGVRHEIESGHQVRRLVAAHLA